MSILASKKSVESVLEKENLTPQQKNKILLSQDVRKFASETLKLTSKGNYSKITWLERPYVTWAVSAAEAWKLKAYEWNFPIVGKVPYLGFFTQKEAEQEQRELQQKGYDTFLRGVSAYSTLGWFEVPLLSSMLNYDDHLLVETLVHELVHTTLWIKDNVEFNERLATFLGQKGAQIFYLEKEGPQSPTVKKILNEQHDEILFSEFITQELKELEAWYENLKDDDRDLETKSKRLKIIQNKFKNDLQPQLKSDLYLRFPDLKLNNARMIMYKTYQQDFSSLEKLWQQVQGDFVLFLEKCKALKDSKNPDADLKKLLIL